jgi:hypothetical protein
VIAHSDKPTAERSEFTPVSNIAAQPQQRSGERIVT